MDILIEIDDPYSSYREMSSKELEARAAFWQGVMFDKGDPRDLSAGSYEWRFDPSYQIEKLEDSGFNWRDWMQEEIDAWTADGDPDRYADMMGDAPIREAVILVEHEGRAWLWDGYHRTGASVIAGRSTIPAIIGCRA